MTKAELVTRLHQKCENDLASCAAAGRVVDEVIELIGEQLERGDDVALPPLGKFRTKRTKAREGRNPQTGDKLKIRAKTVVRFKPASGLARRVNN